MKGCDFATGNYVKAFKDKPLWYLRLKGRVRGFYQLIWMEAARNGLIPLGDTRRDELGEALATIFNEEPEFAKACIEQLLEKGAVSFSADGKNNALVVTDYVVAQTTATLDKVRAQQYRQRQHENAVASSSSRTVTPRSKSSQSEIRSEEIRRDQISPIGECEGAEPPKTDPTPSLLGKKFDESVGKGPEAWGLEGSTRQEIHQEPLAKSMAVPPPPARRQALTLASDDPLGVLATIPPVNGTPEEPSLLFPSVPITEPAKSKTKRKTAKTATDLAPVEVTIPSDWAPNEGHYKLAAEKYGFQKTHVDFLADDMRDKCEAKGTKQVNWDAKFRTWMGNAWQWNDGKPPVVPQPRPAGDPPAPRKPYPPPPPLLPEVQANLDRIQKECAEGRVLDLTTMFDGIGKGGSRFKSP